MSFIYVPTNVESKPTPLQTVKLYSSAAYKCMVVVFNILIYCRTEYLPIDRSVSKVNVIS